MRISVYRINYHTVTKRDGVEIRRTGPVEAIVAGEDFAQAVLALPQPNQDEGSVTENVVLSSHTLQHNVPLGEPATPKLGAKVTPAPETRSKPAGTKVN